MTYLFPAGAQQGQSVEVKVGDASAWPVQIWVSDPALTASPAEEKGKLAIAVADAAPPGVYWLRLYNEEGATSLRPFLVGTLPEAAETEPNDTHSQPQTLESPNVTLNGVLSKSGDVDSFALSLTAGQTLVASLEANGRLGSPLDAVLQIVSPDGFVLEQNDEYHDVDPQIVFTVPDDGRYLVRLFAFPTDPNSTIGFAGRESYVYRLTLTTGGFVDHAYPLAISHDGTAPVRLEGWNVPADLDTVAVQPGADATTAIAEPPLANFTQVRVEPHPTAIEQEPNDGAADANHFTLPQTITGRIESPGDVDVFRFPATKGQALRFAVESRELGFPLDAVLRLLDASGRELKRVDDSGRRTRDAVLDFTAPDDGEYLVEVSDLHDTGGFRYVYRLRAVQPEPDYALAVEADHFVLTVGKPSEVPVAIDRKDGFKEAVEIAAEGLPEGVTIEPASSPAEGDAAKSVKLKLSATMPTAGASIRIVGRVTSQPALARTAEASLADFHTTTQQLWLTVVKVEEKSEKATE